MNESYESRKGRIGKEENRRKRKIRKAKEKGEGDYNGPEAFGGQYLVHAFMLITKKKMVKKFSVVNTKFVDLY